MGVCCDCSAAMENMLLLATDMGLGSLWCGIFPIESRMQQMRDILNMPKNVNPLGMMYVVSFGRKKSCTRKMEDSHSSSD